MNTRLALATAAIAGSLLVAACNSDPEPVPTVTVTAEAPAPEPTPEPSPDPTSEEPDPTESVASPEPTEDSTAGAPGGAPVTDGAPASGEVPPPGTEFTVGDAATLHVQSGEESDQYYGFALVNTTVTSIEPGDPALFEEAANSGDFAGLTPWFVKVSYEWASLEGEPNANMTPRINAFNAEGGELSSVINSTWSAGIPGCELELPDERPYPAGATGANCHVFAVPDSEVIAYAAWRGDDYADGMGSSSGNQYYDDPVTWQAQ